MSNFGALRHNTMPLIASAARPLVLIGVIVVFVVAEGVLLFDLDILLVIGDRDNIIVLTYVF